jgi:hypothetical protein
MTCFRRKWRAHVHRLANLRDINEWWKNGFLFGEGESYIVIVCTYGESWPSHSVWIVPETDKDEVRQEMIKDEAA